MIANNVSTIECLHNCNDLKEFLMLNIDDPLCGIVDFQGDIVEFNGYAVPKEGEVIPVDDDGVHYKVGVTNEVTNTFILTCVKFIDEGFGVELPAYVREELIATLKGEW